MAKKPQTVGKQVARDAVTGRFITRKDVKRRPATTVLEMVVVPTGNARKK